MQIVFNKRKIDFEKLFLYFVILNLFFLVYIQEGQKIVELAISVLATMFTFKMMMSDKTARRKVWFILAVFIYLILVTFMRYGDKYTVLNLQTLYRPAILLIFLTTLSYKKPEVIEDVITNHYVFFNVYYFINLLYMIYQLKIGVFFDNITGFIGIYGTHRLTMVICFLLILNLQKIAELDALRKLFLTIYTGFVLVSALIISSMNDNNALYLLLPIILILYFYTSKKITLSTLIKIFFVLAFAYIAFQQLLSVDEIREFFEKRLLTKIDEMLLIFSEGRMEEERYVYIEYALENLKGTTIGMGIGRFKLVADPIISSLSIELRNWGMSNMASFIAAGGIVFMVSYVLIYTYIAAKPTNNKKLFPVFFIIFFILFYYGQTGTSISMLTAVWMVLFLFRRADRMNNEFDEEDSEDEEPDDNEDDEKESETNESSNLNISLRN